MRQITTRATLLFVLSKYLFEKAFLTRKIGWNGDQNVNLFRFVIRTVPKCFDYTRKISSLNVTMCLYAKVNQEEREHFDRCLWQKNKDSNVMKPYFLESAFRLNARGNVRWKQFFPRNAIIWREMAGNLLHDQIKRNMAQEHKNFLEMA